MQSILGGKNVCIFLLDCGKIQVYLNIPHKNKHSASFVSLPPVKYVIPSNFHSDNNAVFDLYLRQDSKGFVFYKKLLGQPKNINKAVSVSLSC